MSDITFSQYWTEIQDTAENIISEVLSYHFENECTDVDQVQDIINDTALHESIDGHQWVIYYTYNMDVIKHSDNEDYMLDNFGAGHVSASLKEGLSTLHSHIAFWALYADVSDKIHSLIDQMVEDHNEDLEEEEEEE
jgi:hypothetical protein